MHQQGQGSPGACGQRSHTVTESATVTGQQAGGPATQDLGRGALEQKLARAEQREWAWSMAATNTSESSEQACSSCPEAKQGRSQDQRETVLQ